MATIQFFATAARGTEAALAAELTESGIAAVDEEPGGVRFGASLEDGYRACLWSRVASRVLLPLGARAVGDAEALYDFLLELPWTEHIGPEQTLAVSVAGPPSPIGPAHFVALKAKDAIVDRIRADTGRRPNVDKERPDVRIQLHLGKAGVTVNLDLAGSGLHRRGLGRAGSDAPMKENLAAALLRIAGWPARTGDPLFDPMCGSGTLLLEAAAIAHRAAPGLARGRMGLERWRGHDAGLWQRLVAEAKESRRRIPLRIAGADNDPRALDAARETAKRAGFERDIRFERGDLKDSRPPWDGPGLVITNPPYGARLGDASHLGPLYQLLGDVLKRRFAGWDAYVLSGDRALDKKIGLRPKARKIVFNGPIECRFLHIPIAATPLATSPGPAWRKVAEARLSPEVRGFKRKLETNLKAARRVAEREGTTCYRVYDSDIPHYNLAVDWYDGAVRLEEYHRPKQVVAADAERRIAEALPVVAEVLGVPQDEVVVRVRRRLAKGEQYERFAQTGEVREVREGDLLYEVNLSDYLDTGLFLDDRRIRAWLRTHARDRDFLNLYSYTCAASVAAAKGGARSTTSIDLSKRYLAWGERNFALNGIRGEHRFIRADASRFLDEDRGQRRFGLVFVAPPTRSRSKGMEADFDVQRDHADLLLRAATLLRPDGDMLFTTNFRTFEFDAEKLAPLAPHELTKELTPSDFMRRPRLRAWRLNKQ